MADDTKTPPPAAADKAIPKGAKLLKFRSKEPMGEMVRGEMVRVGKGEIIELTAERAKSISFLVDPVE